MTQNQFNNIVNILGTTSNGTTKVLVIKDSTSAEVASIDTDGNVIASGTVTISNLAGTGTRVVQVSDTGLLSAGEVMSHIMTDSTDIALITDTNNWTLDGLYGNYTGTDLTNVYAGTWYLNDQYLFFAYNNNEVVRLIRG